MNAPFISVIIPTYNRSQMISRCMESLDCQDLHVAEYEVVVVDDGSIESYAEVLGRPWNCQLRYIKQENLGGTCAKNVGASLAQGEILCYIDDDITVSPNYLSELMAAHRVRPHSIIMGHLINVPIEPVSIFGAIRSHQINYDCTDVSELVELKFTECLGGFFSIRKVDFFELGQLQGVGGGWPNWEDLDLSYRAFEQGYKLYLCPNAKGYHYDHSMASLNVQTRRWERAAQVAVLLFQKYPRLSPHVSTFRDKMPISFRSDPPALIIRKVGRYVTSRKPFINFMERLVQLLEHHFPHPFLLAPLYRWIISSYIYRGYRKGLQEC